MSATTVDSSSSSSCRNSSGSSCSDGGSAAARLKIHGGLTYTDEDGSSGTDETTVDAVDPVQGSVPPAGQFTSEVLDAQLHPLPVSLFSGGVPVPSARAGGKDAGKPAPVIPLPAPVCAAPPPVIPIPQQEIARPKLANSIPRGFVLVTWDATL